MHPILFSINLFGKDILIGTYGVLMVAGFAAAGSISLVRARQYGQAPGEYANYLPLVGAGTIGGALLAGFLLFLPERPDWRFVDYPPAFVSWGGIIGGIAGLVLSAYWWKKSFPLLADILAPGYLVGMGIGRVGCFFAGCCYGVHATSCTGICFSDPAAPAAAMAQPLVPTQLISAAFLVGAGSILLHPVFRRLPAGVTFALSAIAYSFFRFSIEFWRDDPRVFFMGLSDGQLFSLAYFMFGACMLLYSRMQNVKDRDRGMQGR